MLERITAPGGPAPLGPYSHAVRAGDLVFVSGQAALNPETNQLEAGAAAAQTRRVLENIRTILQAAGADLSDVVKCCVFLADIQVGLANLAGGSQPICAIIDAVS